MGKSQENLKTICFEGEMLPNWAQLLDAAARMCPVDEHAERLWLRCGIWWRRSRGD